MNGWISLHRKIRSNPVFNDLQLFRLWIICLTEASHKEHKILVGKQTVVLQPGEFVTGRFEIGAKYNEGLKPKDRVQDITVWRWLKTLEELEFMIIKSNNKFSLCTIVKWSEYQNVDQQNDQQMINKRSANDQQMITNNNGNKGDNENKGDKKEYIHFEDMPHVKITQTDFDKLETKLGSKEKVMDKLYNFASWILGQSEKKQKSVSAYLSIVNWHKRDLEKQSAPSIHKNGTGYSTKTEKNKELLLKHWEVLKNGQRRNVEVVDADFDSLPDGRTDRRTN